MILTKIPNDALKRIHSFSDTKKDRKLLKKLFPDIKCLHCFLASIRGGEISDDDIIENVCEIRNFYSL